MLLPGHVRKIRAEDICPCQYDACNAEATHEYCVSADSMGAEWLPLCAEHVEAFKADVETGGPTVDTCDWCKTPEVEVFPFRDWEEGNNGPVSDVCNVCIHKSNKYAEDELKRMEDEEGDGHDEAMDDFEEMPEMSLEELEAQFLDDDPEDDKYHALNDVILSIYQGAGCGIGQLRKYITEAEALGNDFTPTQHMQMTGPVKVGPALGFTFHWVGIPTLNVAWFPDGEVYYCSMEMEKWYTYPANHLIQVVNKLAALGYPVKDLSYEQSWEIIEDGTDWSKV